MAIPNIVNVANIYGHTAYVVPATAGTNNTNWQYHGPTGSNIAAITGLTPGSGAVNRVTSISVSNFTGSAATATVQIGNNATFSSANLVANLAYQIAVPAQATLVVVDKTASFYLNEYQSLSVSAGTANALTFVAVFEAIS